MPETLEMKAFIPEMWARLGLEKKFMKLVPSQSLFSLNYPETGSGHFLREHKNISINYMGSMTTISAKTPALPLSIFDDDRRKKSFNEIQIMIGVQQEHKDIYDTYTEFTTPQEYISATQFSQTAFLLIQEHGGSEYHLLLLTSKTLNHIEGIGAVEKPSQFAQAVYSKFKDLQEGMPWETAMTKFAEFYKELKQATTI